MYLEFSNYALPWKIYRIINNRQQRNCFKIVAMKYKFGELEAIK